MSKSGKSSDVSSDVSSADKKSSNPQALRLLAPKPPPVSPGDQLSGARTTSLPPAAGSSRRRSPAACAVCFRVGCQLPTHTAYSTSTASRSSSASSVEKPSVIALQNDPIFASSYAFRLGQHGSPSVSSSRTDPLYSLPLDAEMNTVEMQQLFHSWFDVNIHQSFKLPRPPEIAGDIIWSPFFMPALQDSLLCLSVLAASAASRPRSLGQPSRNVMSLTLLGQAIQQMRERIRSDPEDIADTTIIAAVFLWLANIFLEDTAAMTSHANSIYAFVETRGGLHELDFVGAVANFIRWVDACHSFVLPVACQYLDSQGLTPPLESSATRYGAFWDIQAPNAKISIEAAVVSACQHTCRLIEQLEDVENTRISGAQYTRTVQRLGELYTSGSVLRARSHNQGDVNECVVVALSLIQFHRFCGLENFDIIVTTNVPRLMNAIKSTGGPPFWQKEPNLLIWLLFVAVMSPTTSGEKSWCLPFLCRIVSTQFGTGGELNNAWRQQLKSCLRAFVWSDSYLEQYFTDTCRAIEQELEDDDDDDDDEDAMDED